MDKLRIIFMGTPEFAVASLMALLENNFNVVAVVTAPDRPAGRGMQLQKSAVKVFAESKNIPVLQPVLLRDAAFIEQLKSYEADLQVVVAFRMLPQVVWNMPTLGTINVHGSLLPQYRGAAPINWAIINGEKETGVTTFKLKQEIDTGNILLQQPMSIGEDENAGSVHDQMKEVGAQLLVKTLKRLLQGNLVEQPQPVVAHLRNAPKITTETCEINFNHTVDEVFNLIRGLSPHPGAFTYLDDKVLKIFAAKKEYSFQGNQISPGIITDGKTMLMFRCSDGCISATDIQLQGKKRMLVQDFLRGYRFKGSL